MSDKSYFGETKIMLRSEPVPIYPEYIKYQGLYKHVEVHDGKVYVWSENIVTGNRDWRGHNDSIVSIAPAGTEYKGFVTSPVWIGDFLYHLIEIEMIYAAAQYK
jgi:hypothetical protein